MKRRGGFAGHTLNPRKAFISCGNYLVMTNLAVLVVFLLSIVAVPSVVTAIARAGNSSPNILPGDYVTFSCDHGAVYLGGTLVCHDGSTSKDVCDSANCTDSLSATMDSGYTFSKWTDSGDASVWCKLCSSTKVSFNVPNPGNIYSGSVTLNP